MCAGHCETHASARRLYPELFDFPEKCFVVDFEKRGRPRFFSSDKFEGATNGCFFRILD